MQKKLTQLAAKAAQKGQWALAAAAARASAGNGVDDHINVLGAMHESGLLKNSSAPFAKVWRDGDTPAFAAACVKRLVTGDADYWALAALLGASVAHVAPAFRQAGFELLAIRRMPAFKDPELHVAALALRDAAAPETLAPLIELGWNASTGELYDLARWRAVILQAVQGAAPQLSGRGFGSYFMRAKLPYGCWRILHDDFQLDAKAAIPHDHTLWPGASKGQER
jgi:hypothetical protein